MLNFIIATLIYMFGVFAGAAFDTFVWYPMTGGDMPIAMYYTIAWLAAGVYCAYKQNTQRASCKKRCTLKKRNREENDMNETRPR